MKTPEQIKAWLEAQPWYEQFKSRVLNDSSPSEDKRKILNGELGEITIFWAFLWPNNEIAIWENANRQFLEWYNEENPD